MYFITSRVRDGASAFKSEAAKEVWWDRFDHYAEEFGFFPFVTTILDNHYHTEGYLRVGDNLGPMMQRLHGSVAKLVNDLLDVRVVPFWNENGRYKHNYFDGCIRNEKQLRLAYRYTLMQSVKAGLVRDWREYPHTRVDVDVERAVARAKQLKAFLPDVPYKRYER